MSKHNKYFTKIKKNKFLLFLLLIFAAEIFLRFYEINTKSPFGYDQVDNAWAAKNIIVNHWYPLVGMVAKANSGIYIGPAYYYFISIFYFFTNLNPIAAGIIAGLTSLFSFWVIYFFTKELFNKNVALIAVIIHTFSQPATVLDRIQWPVNFIPALSYIIFFLLYKIMRGDVKKIIPLAITIGLMFNVHFTAIFFPIIIFFCLPFFPRTISALKYALISLPLFLIWLVPSVIYTLSNKTYSSNSSYLLANYHGFHLRRMVQILGDAIIQFDVYIVFDKLKPLKVLLVPIFFVVYFLTSKKSDIFKFLYLVFLWFMIPWIIFSLYSGEISDYYFSLQRFVVLAILSFLIYKIWEQKSAATKGLVALLIAAYCFYNFSSFLSYKDVGLAEREKRVIDAINENRRIEFQIGVPESYIYYYYMSKKGKIVY